VTRRLLLPAVLEELLVAVGEYHGVHGFRMGDLRTAPDEVIGGIVPVRAAGCRVFLADGQVCTVDRAGEQLRLFPVGSFELDAFNACDGQRDVAAVASGVAERWDVSPDEAFDLVRDLVVRLLAVGVLLPANPLEGGP
ncbi:MAG TPA: hypothetical protein VN257_02595, partial [Actinotalea sp.]|nr:hypothetical protein [Actinotalea sp.]